MYRALNFSEHFLIFISAVSGSVSISAFTLLVGVPFNITSSAERLKICAITARIKNYKSIVKKKRKTHDLIVLLAKTKLNAMTVLVSKILRNLYINHDDFF